MQTVEEIAKDILRREGGFVNDPDDPGGATNHGVTIGTLRRLGLDLNGDGDVDISDVRQLSAAQALNIYLQHYFERPKIGRLPDVLQPSVFDMYVNAGSNAVKLLQRLLGQMGQELTVDGVIGPQTIAAAEAAVALAPHHIADAYAIARRNYYFTLADKRDILREAVFLCSTPFDTPRISSGCASFNAVCAAPLSPEAMAVSTRFKKVRMRLIRLLLISARFALRRIRFFADLWFAIK